MFEDFKKNRAKSKLIKKTSHVHTLSTWEIIKGYLQKGLATSGTKESAADESVSLLAGGNINHIAIVLDGTVEEVFRAQNRLTALLLSEPQFVEFNPREVYPQIGITKYLDGKFVNYDGSDMQSPELDNHSGHNHDNAQVGHEESFPSFNVDDYLTKDDIEKIKKKEEKE